MANVLVVAAHPDDEILGCGGTLLKHIDDGDSVTVIVLTKGRKKYNFEELRDNTNFNYALANFESQKLEQTNITQIVDIIEEVALKCNPDIVYTHSDKDLQIDHRKTLEAVLVAFRPTNRPIKILSFEVLSSSEYNTVPFQPNYYNNIDEYLTRKLDILNFYADEMRAYPHPRSFEGVKIQAQNRGLTVGMIYAEAFEIVRIINK